MAATAALALAALAAAAPTLPTLRSAAAIGPRRRLLGLAQREAAAVAAAGLVWGFPNAGFVTLLGFAPGFFAGRGVAGHLAAALAGLVAFATVPVGPFGGWLLGGLKRPSLGVAAGIALVAVSMALLARGVAPVLLLLAAGVALGTVSGPIVALPAAVLAPERRAVGMGLFWTVFFVPMTLLPPLAGLARDLTGEAGRGAARRRGLLRRAGAARARRLRWPPPACARGGRHGSRGGTLTRLRSGVTPPARGPVAAAVPGACVPEAAGRWSSPTSSKGAREPQWPRAVAARRAPMDRGAPTLRRPLGYSGTPAFASPSTKTSRCAKPSRRRRSAPTRTGGSIRLRASMSTRASSAKPRWPQQLISVW
jgi:hypothetical protein